MLETRFKPSLPNSPLLAAMGCGLGLVVCGHIGLAAAIYLGLCDIALDKPGLLWDAVAATVSGGFVASGRRLMADAE
ncbi:hypothetical protein [Azospirillum canadense]|uniref:hypothetical protein n=1 Tax=Azospirillum canadense TaxID=403962 RepID=UPI002225F6B4|nr:hypothetical protein [Azospirillum canadense]MCW2244284.1 hypothetical protein [Azospirillum canadense]